MAGKNVTWRLSFSASIVHLVYCTSVFAGTHPPPVLHKDVVILGGGASGSYAAVRLREDYKKSILLVEKEPILGGHTNTYIIPETGEAFNYGVQSYIDYKGAKAFFKRFGIPLQPSVLFASDTVLVNPATNQPASLPPAIPINESVAAIQKWHDLISPWNDQLLPGYWDFFSPSEIPPDLLLPFPEVVAKYSLEAMGPILAIVSGINISEPQPTLYVTKNFGTPVVEGFLENTFFDPVPFNNSLLYQRAGELLGSDVALSSSIVAGDRSVKNGFVLTMQNDKTGAQTTVVAKRLLIAVPPSVNNLAFLSLDDQEKAVFETWSFGSVYTAVLKTNLIPDNTSLAFAGLLTSSSPVAPGQFSFSANWNGVSGYYWLILFSESTWTAEQATAAILAEMENLYNAGTFSPTTGTEPRSSIAQISDHSSARWGQSAAQIKDGFIQDLYALQGHKNTWYTGGLWCPDYSSNVWAFTDTVLPKLLQGI